MDFTKVLDDNILHDLYQWFEVADLRSLRLVNRQSNASASGFLFETIVVKHRKDSLDSLTTISENETFAKGVREIVWETGHYYHPFEDDGQGDSLREAVRIAVLGGDLAIGADEVVDVLTRAFTRFRGLRKARIVNWACKPRSLLPMTEEGRNKTPFFFDNHSARHLEAFGSLSEALNAAGRSLASLHIEAVDPAIATHFRRYEGDSHMLDMLLPLQHPSLSDEHIIRLAAPLQQLKVLRLRFRSESEQLTDLIRSGRLALFLSQLPKLEDLELSLEGTVSANRWDGDDFSKTDGLAVFPSLPLTRLCDAQHAFAHLRRLALDSMWLDTVDLCAFLQRHSATLKSLSLTWVVLGRARSAEQLYWGTTCPKKVLALYSRSAKPVYKADINDDDRKSLLPDRSNWPQQKLVEWPLIVHACLEMPVLENTLFSNLMETQHTALKTPIIVIDPVGLEEQAMHRR